MLMTRDDLHSYVIMTLPLSFKIFLVSVYWNMLVVLCKI